jgi:hypothetical protein
MNCLKYIKELTLDFGKYPIQFILLRYYVLYLKKCGQKYFSFHHDKVIKAITKCKTSLLGGGLTNCNKFKPSKSDTFFPCPGDCQSI